jgi:hypothetical protein
MGSDSGYGTILTTPTLSLQAHLRARRAAPDHSTSTSVLFALSSSFQEYYFSVYVLHQPVNLSRVQWQSNVFTLRGDVTIYC